MNRKNLIPIGGRMDLTSGICNCLLPSLLVLLSHSVFLNIIILKIKNQIVHLWMMKKKQNNI